MCVSKPTRTRKESVPFSLLELRRSQSALCYLSKHQDEDLSALPPHRTCALTVSDSSASGCRQAESATDRVHPPPHPTTLGSALVPAPSPQLLRGRDGGPVMRRLRARRGGVAGRGCGRLAAPLAARLAARLVRVRPRCRARDGSGAAGLGWLRCMVRVRDRARVRVYGSGDRVAARWSRQRRRPVCERRARLARVGRGWS